MECFTDPVEKTQAASECSYPEIAAAVFINLPDIIIAKACRVVRFVEKLSETVAVEAIKAILCAQPEETFAVFPKAIDLALRQALFRREVSGDPEWALLALPADGRQKKKSCGEKDGFHPRNLQGICDLPFK